MAGGDREKSVKSKVEETNKTNQPIKPIILRVSRVKMREDTVTKIKNENRCCRWMSELSKVARDKSNIQKLIVLLYMNNEQSWKLKQYHLP
jgi:hypothetical protein